jgi:hypothetical protein
MQGFHALRQSLATAACAVSATLLAAPVSAQETMVIRAPQLKFFAGIGLTGGGSDVVDVSYWASAITLTQSMRSTVKLPTRASRSSCSRITT